MIKTKKQMYLIIAIFTLVLFLGGTTYAWFTYRGETGEQELVAGDIYLTMTEGNETLTLTNIFPETKEEARARDDNYLTFSLDGLNTSNKTIYYEIMLNHGEDKASPKSRYNDSDLKFDLVELDSNGDEVNYLVDAASYDTLINKRIWVDTIDASTSTNVSRKYKLRAWLSDEVIISDTEANANYTTVEFPNKYATIKIKVFGDFQEKELPGAINKIKKNVITPANPINFGDISSDTNGKGLYILPGTENNTNPIYYYRGEVDNNNVVFGGFCWLMVRTTDTGGIKMIYNGIATGTNDNPTCENAVGAARQLSSTSVFNTNYSSMADVGYMYNTRYEYQSKSTFTETMLSSTSLNTTYWYADAVTWGSPTSNSYNLDNPYQVTATTDYPSLVGKYTFRNTSQTYINTLVYYIAAVNNTTMYYITLSNSGNHTLSDFNYTYTYGDGYTDLGNGTYEITDTTSVTTINRSDWYTSYSNLNNKYVCKNATNNICSEVWYVTSTSNTEMIYLKVSNIKFSNGISNYNSETGTYTLDSDNAVSFWDIANATNKASLNNAHYTCWNESGICATLSYIYYLDGTIYYYINLTGGDLVEDALYKMTGNGSSETKAKNAGYVLNTTSSTAKTNIENWFKANLTNEIDASKPNYQEYLEDTTWCNDRSYSVMTGAGTYEEAGWNPNGGSVTTSQYFAAGGRRWINNYYSSTKVPVISCPNETDQFRVGNTQAKLNYPVGLLTTDEIIMAGAAGNSANFNNNYYLYNGSTNYWSLSPSYFNNYGAYDFIMFNNYIRNYRVGTAYGLRPAVSLKPGTEFEEGGEGTTLKPYIVKMGE